MTALDWGLALIVGLSALLGLARGLIGVAASLAAWLLAGVAAVVFGGDVGRSLGDGQVGWGEYLGGYALCFVVVWVGVGLIGWVVRRIAHSYGLSEMDRLLGLALGAVRGVIFACALLVFLGMTTLPRERAWRESGLAAVLMPGAELMRSALPEAMARKVDLEGRGTSLQASVQEQAEGLEKELKGRLPKGLPDALGDPATTAAGKPQGGALPQALPEDLGGLSQALPAAVRDLIPRANRGADRTQTGRVEGDPAQVDSERRDDKQVQ
ncbi:CvpA family protein [Lysobacter firmicutimachus]|uniref:CvpA family protein n=1 Tax=Lysobacter firmicutimachus TaxID=1792846 RepID=A0AAU8MPP9_9GAMM